MSEIVKQLEHLILKNCVAGFLSVIDYVFRCSFEAVTHLRVNLQNHPVMQLDAGRMQTFLLWVFCPCAGDDDDIFLLCIQATWTQLLCPWPTYKISCAGKPFSEHLIFGEVHPDSRKEEDAASVSNQTLVCLFCHNSIYLFQSKARQ